ncbi:MAG: addiction module protein [Candidatus Binatia bacterium]
MSRPSLNINSLSTTERLRLLEELWDSLSGSPDVMPLSDAQREELDRRLDDLERSGANGIPWEEVLQQIRARPR